MNVELVIERLTIVGLRMSQRDAALVGAGVELTLRRMLLGTSGNGPQKVVDAAPALVDNATSLANVKLDALSTQIANSVVASIGLWQ